MPGMEGVFGGLEALGTGAQAMNALKEGKLGDLMQQVIAAQEGGDELLASDKVKASIASMNAITQQNATPEDRQKAGQQIVTAATGLPLPTRPIPLALSLYLWGDKVLHGLQRFPLTSWVFSALDKGLRMVPEGDKVADELLDHRRLQQRRGELNQKIIAFIDDGLDGLGRIIQETDKLTPEQKQAMLRVTEGLTIDDDKLQRLAFSAVAPAMVDSIGDWMFAKIHRYVGPFLGDQHPFIKGAYHLTHDEGKGKKLIQLAAFASGVISAFSPELRAMNNDFVNIAVDLSEEFTNVLRVGTMNEFRAAECDVLYLSSPETLVAALKEKKVTFEELRAAQKMIRGAKEQLYYYGDEDAPVAVTAPAKNDRSPRAQAWQMFDQLQTMMTDLDKAAADAEKRTARIQDKDERQEKAGAIIHGEFDKICLALVKGLLKEVRESDLEMGGVTQYLHHFEAAIGAVFGEGLAARVDAVAAGFRERNLPIQEIAGSSDPDDKKINRLAAKGYVIAEDDRHYYYGAPIGTDPQKDYVGEIRQRIEAEKEETGIGLHGSSAAVVVPEDEGAPVSAGVTRRPVAATPVPVVHTPVEKTPLERAMGVLDALQRAHASQGLIDAAGAEVVRIMQEMNGPTPGAGETTPVGMTDEQRFGTITPPSDGRVTRGSEPEDDGLGIFKDFVETLDVIPDDLDTPFLESAGDEDGSAKRHKDSGRGRGGSGSSTSDGSSN